MSVQSKFPELQALKDCYSKAPNYFNFADIIDSWADEEKNGGRQSEPPALWWIDNSGSELKWTFQDVSLRSKRVANLFSKVCSVSRGDSVMVIVPRIPEFWLLFLACARTGSVIVPIPINIGPAELKLRIKVLKPKCITCDIGVNSVILSAIDEVVAMEPECRVQSRLLIHRTAADMSSREGWLQFEELFDKQSSSHKSIKSLAAEPIVIFFTSGTTGNSKMVEHTQTSVCLFSLIRSKEYGFTSEDLLWCLTSMGWVAMVTHGLTLPWFVGAGIFIHCEPLSTEATLLMLQKYPVSSVLLLPSTLFDILKVDLKSFNFPKLRHCITSGEPVATEILIDWKHKTGLDIRVAYAQTETGLISITPRGDETRPGSVGRPVSCLDVKILDDSGQEVEPGVIGNFAIRAVPNRPLGLFSRYKDNPEKTQAAFRGDFYFTGDRGMKDNDGYLWFSERCDDAIFSAGQNIHPYLVEACLNKHPAVSLSAVVSTPHPTQGKGIKAFIVLNDGYTVQDESALVKELQDHVTNETAGWMSPHKVEIVENLPRTLTGKISRSELRKKEWDQK